MKQIEALGLSPARMSRGHWEVEFRKRLSVAGLARLLKGMASQTFIQEMPVETPLPSR